MSTRSKIEAIDLFCGAGGLTHGLARAGIRVKAGLDIDDACRYPFEANNRAKFIGRDIREVTGASLAALYSPNAVRLLAGCAPCQPFSTLAKGPDKSVRQQWRLLEEFARLVRELSPELITMENVPRVRNHEPYKNFLDELKRQKYEVAAGVLRCAQFGVPQDRRRFVLIASRLGPVTLPKESGDIVTVAQAIGHLPHVKAGEVSKTDSLHKARSLSPTNMMRIRASVPGGTWEDWPEELRSACHTREAGASFKSVYARMRWDMPSPTITTQCHNFGTGRFGHPEQDRALTLREAAVLQSFPDTYQFAAPKSDISFQTVGRLIGNAVPPKLAEAVGKYLAAHVKQYQSKKNGPN